MCIQLCFGLLKSQYDRSLRDPIFTLCNQASNNERQVFSCNGFSMDDEERVDCHYANAKRVCEQAEHVTSPQEMKYNVTMKTRTNLCRNIGVHTKPLKGVSIRKNVS